ncbi:hypothetical protein HYT84_03550 [Candidatus Micrarchaeota archaeon]|nr:hypothetical protein [Candidatus Micrarchaeota archaeon]
MKLITSYKNKKKENLANQPEYYNYETIDLFEDRLVFHYNKSDSTVKFSEVMGVAHMFFPQTEFVELSLIAPQWTKKAILHGQPGVDFCTLIPLVRTKYEADAQFKDALKKYKSSK